MNKDLQAIFPFLCLISFGDCQSRRKMKIRQCLSMVATFLQSFIYESRYHIYFSSANMMSGEHSQDKAIFSGKKGEIQVIIFLEAIEGRQVLVIQLRNQSKMQFYQQRVDHLFLQNNPEMAFCFQTVEDLYYTLVQLFEEVTITADGILTFEMKLNASKLKKKVFRLETQRQDIDKNEMLGLKMETLRKQLRQQLITKDEKIRALGKQTEELRGTVEMLREQVVEMKRQAEELSLQYKKRDFKMNSMAKESEMQRQQIALLRKVLEQFHKKFATLEFYNFFDNPHWHNFSVCRGEHSVTIVKKDSDSVWHSFIRNAPLSGVKTYHFQVKQRRTSYRNIMMGICTRECFGVTYAYKSKNSLAYNSYSGNVWEQGSSRRGGPSIMDGQTVGIEIGLAQQRVVWFIEGKKVAEAGMGEEMRGKEVFLSLQFYNIEDELQLMHY